MEGALPAGCHPVLGTGQALPALWSSARHLRWFLPWVHGDVPIQAALVSVCRLFLQTSVHTGVCPHVLKSSEQQIRVDPPQSITLGLGPWQS